MVMMKLTKHIRLFLLLNILCTSLFAQDAVIIADGNFLRGTIKGTDFSAVQLLLDDQTVREFKAKDIKEFLWNGDTYVSMPIILKNKSEYRFLRLEESGAVNLYSMGNTSLAEAPAKKRVQVRPAVGVGLGSGGYGGVGFGGGISFGGGGGSGRRAASPRNISYYLLKPGTGPMVTLPLKGSAGANNEQVRMLLLQKLADDEDLAERIKATETFDAKNVQAFISAYNAMKK